MNVRLTSHQHVWLALIVSSLVSVGLYGFGALRNHTFDFWYLPYNLALALIPLLLAIWLVSLLKKYAWTHWTPSLVTFLWLLFLPNSFYIVSDFIHLTETPRVDIVQDVVMLAQFSFTGMAFGFISLFFVHQELSRRINGYRAGLIITAILMLSSIAIYVGRDLRWNSWDIIIQPFALISDIFRHVLNPVVYPSTFIITLSFFAMLVSMYLVLWQCGKAFLLRSKAKK